MDKLKLIANKWIEAFNNHEIDAILSLYAEDAIHYSPKLKALQPHTNGLIKGKPALKAWWTDAFDRLPNLHYQLLQLTCDDNRVFMEYTRQTPGEEDMQVGELFTINDNLIVSSRVYHSN